MLAFSNQAPLPLRASSSRRLCFRTRSVSGNTPRCSVDRQQADTPTTIDELVRSWFKPWGSNKNDEQAQTSVMSKAIYGPCSGPKDVHYLLSTRIVARKDSVRKMTALLRELSEAANSSNPENGILLCAVNQCPDEPELFIMLERFASRDVMDKYQKGPAYQKFVREAQPLLEAPFGVHICKEMGGKVSQSYYPFGPGGEGGRDDMIKR